MADLDEHFLSLVASLLAADAFGLPLARGAVASRGGPHGRDGNAIIWNEAAGIFPESAEDWGCAA